MAKPFKIENEKYNIRLTTSTGQESLLGVSDVVSSCCLSFLGVLRSGNGSGTARPKVVYWYIA